MATKSPGIYYNEIDNTQFSNPKSISGTTLAVVGYARKGPLDKPVEISSWNDFIDTFGKPIESQYSGLAVRLFISAGGTVLFKRIADDANLSPSIYIVKNGKPKQDGWISLTPGDVAQNAIEPLSIYTFNLQIGSGPKKAMFIRTPEPGKALSQFSIVEQIDNQREATPAIFEANLSKKPLKNSIYGFKLKYGDAYACNKNNFYLETKEASPNESIKSKMELALQRSNATCTIEFCASNTWGDGSFTSNDNYGELIEGKKIFFINKMNANQETSTTEISVDFGSSVTGEQIAEEINKKLDEKKMGVRVIYIAGSTGSDFDKLIFIDMFAGPKSTLNVSSLNEMELNPSDLFAKQTGGEEEIGGTFADAGDLAKGHLFIHKYTNNEAVANSYFNKLEILFDKSTKSFSIKTKDAGATPTCADIAIENTEYKKDGLSLLEGKNAIFDNYFNFKGQDKLDFTIEKDLEEDKIIIKGAEKPTISKVDSEDPFFEKSKKYETFYDFIDLKKEENSGQPQPAILDSDRDMIIFTSKEKGSGTTGKIGVEIKSVINPLNENEAPKRTLTVYYKNSHNTFNPKETFENISLDWEDTENRIDIKLTKDAENGGSNYIGMRVENKKEGNIEIPDGFWVIGEKNKDTDIKRGEFTDIENYESYNYSEGNDGIPDQETGGEYLFEEAMDPMNSQLANKDLYDFHILLAPDGYRSQVVQDACIRLCEKRGDAITIVDPPVGLSKNAVIEWHNGRGGYGRNTPLDSNYVATYWPWCKIYDISSGKGKFTWVMPSVIMAAQYVMVDKNSGPQAAPAGEVNGTLPVIDIEDYPNPHDRDELYTEFNRINPITKFKDGTVVAYGEKTTQRKNSVLTKIHTRRMLVQIKKQCKEALKGYIFMPTTSEYLGKIANNITAILESYKSKGGLNFYKVICDETNNPIETRQQDIINVDAVLVPQGTIEQININLTLDKNSETVSD